MATQTNINFGFHHSNWKQLTLHFAITILIGITLRLTTFQEATVIASQLGSERYLSKTSFLISFGFTKAISNLVVGRISDIWGRKLPHVIGWGFGILLGCSLLKLASITTTSSDGDHTDTDTTNHHLLWMTYVFANICLGAQQGWTWTTNIFMFIDILGPKNRALASAISNSVGYLTSAFATYAAASLSTDVAFGLVLASSLVGCSISMFLIEDTSHFVARESVRGDHHSHGQQRQEEQSVVVCGEQEMVRRRDVVNEEGNTNAADTTIHQMGEDQTNVEDDQDEAFGDHFGLEEDADKDRHQQPSIILEQSFFASVFWETCWQNPSAAVLCWGGLTANLVTSLAWGLVLIWGHQQDLTSLQLANIGSAFTFSKAFAMIVSGYISDRTDRRRSVLLGGFVVTSAGLLLTAWADATTNPTEIYIRLCVGGIIIGCGIGSVYCVLTAALSDHTAPRDRASAIGVYKLWRDSGYAFGGLLTGWVADASGGSFVTTTTVVAGLVMVLVVSIGGLYEEVSSKTRPSFEPVELIENTNKVREID